MKDLTTLLKCFFAALSLVMVGVTIKTSLQVNLFHVLPDMIRDPWTLATFIDLYFNMLIIFTWVVYKENHLVKSIGWLVLFLCFGSIATAGYVFLKLCQLGPGEPPENVLVRRASA